jgi:hypothetical protein
VASEHPDGPACQPFAPHIHLPFLHTKKRGVDVCEKRVFKIEPTGVARSSATMRLQKFLEVERFDPDQAAGEPDDRKLAAVRPTSDCPGRAADVVARLLEGQEPARGSRSRADGSRHSGLLIQSPGWNPVFMRVPGVSCTCLALVLRRIGLLAQALRGAPGVGSVMPGVPGYGQAKEGWCLAHLSQPSLVSIPSGASRGRGVGRV